MAAVNLELLADDLRQIEGAAARYPCRAPATPRPGKR